MRKSLVLALALVLAIAGASFAAEITWSGEFEATADYVAAGAPEDVKFFGPFDTGAGAGITVNLEDGNDLWDMTLGVRGLLGATPTLGKYRVNVNEGAFGATAWGNYWSVWGVRADSIGNKGDGLGFVTMSGQNTSNDPKFRVTTELGGFDVAAQIDHDHFGLNGETEFDAFTLGATAAFHQEGSPGSENGFTRFGIYGGFDAGIVDIDAAISLTSYQKNHSRENKDTTAFGVKASSDITEQLSLGARFQSVEKNAMTNNRPYPFSFYDDSMFGVEATYTEGLMQFGLEHQANTALLREADDKASFTELGIIYRGHEDNEDFGDVFGGSKYYNNVGFAFGGSYRMEDVKQGSSKADGSFLTLQATGPIVPEQFWILGEVLVVDAKAGSDQHDDLDDFVKATVLDLHGYAKVGEKLVIKPYIGMVQGTDINDKKGNVYAVEASAEYALTEDVTLDANLGQTSFGGDFGPGVVRYNGVGISVKF